MVPIDILPVRQRLPVDSSLSGAGITIAVLDGLFGYHPDLESNAVRKVCHVDPFSQYSDDDPAMIYGRQWQHGIGAASIAGGSGKVSNRLHTGIAPQADLILARGYPTDNNGKLLLDIRHVVQAFEWLVSHQEKYGIRIIQLEIGWGGEDYDMARGSLPWVLFPDRQRVEWAVSRGLIVVVPVANASGCLAPHLFVSPSALMIGGVDIPSSNRDFGTPTFKPYPCLGGELFGGRQIPDLVAPATQMIIAKASEKTGLAIREDAHDYTTRDGGSYAGPYVTGVIGQMLEVNPGLAPCDVATILRETAFPMDGIPVDQQGQGVIQPADATRAARTAQGQQSTSEISFEEWRQRTFGTPETAIANLLSSEAEVRLNGALAVCYHGSKVESVIEINQLRSLFEDADPWIRGAVVCTIGQWSPALWRADLLDSVLRDSNPHVRAAALWALARRPVLHNLRPIEVKLQDGHQDVRLRAAMEMFQRADEKALPAVVEAMQVEVERGAYQFNTLRRAAERITGKQLVPDTKQIFTSQEELQTFNREIARLWHNHICRGFHTRNK